MTRNRGNAIVKFIMIVAVAAVIFLALDFWLGSQKTADEMASGPAPVSETDTAEGQAMEADSAESDSAGTDAESQAASQAASAARAAVTSGMTLEEAREMGRKIGSEIGTEIGTSVGEETARSIVDERVSDEGELVADAGDAMDEPAEEAPAEDATEESMTVEEQPAEPESAEPSIQEEVAEETSPEMAPEPASDPEPAPEPEPAEVAEAEPAAPPPAPKPKPKPKPSQYWWTSSFVEGGLGVGFVGPYKDSGVAVLFTAPVDGGSLADNLKLTKGGQAVSADWKVSDKNARMAYASGLEAGSYRLRIGAVKSSDGREVKRASSGSVTVK